MKISEIEISIPKPKNDKANLDYFKNKVYSKIKNKKSYPIKFVIPNSSCSKYDCDISIISHDDESCNNRGFLDIFEFKKRKCENNKEFNIAFLVPTGIGCEIGGHSGDATPVVRMLSSICENIITHPNVLNAADINEMTNNCIYVEGSSICRLLMGTIGLQKVRSNRVLAVLDKSKHDFFNNAILNSINAARITLGLELSSIIILDSLLTTKSFYAKSKRAIGVIENTNQLFSAIEKQLRACDAIALSSIIQSPDHYHMDYFLSKGDMVNPWGGAESMLTHALSYHFNIPSAHAPIFESLDLISMDPGVVDPRMAAEAVSTTYFHSVLKGLHQSPKIVTDQTLLSCNYILSAKDIDCLIIPDGCLGLPTLAALEQGIKVIAVKENKNIMSNILEELPWQKGQFFCVENYWEVAGVLSALKRGVSPYAIRRPF